MVVNLEESETTVYGKSIETGFQPGFCRANDVV